MVKKWDNLKKKESQIAVSTIDNTKVASRICSVTSDSEWVFTTDGCGYLYSTKYLLRISQKSRSCYSESWHPSGPSFEWPSLGAIILRSFLDFLLLHYSSNNPPQFLSDTWLPALDAQGAYLHSMDPAIRFLLLRIVRFPNVRIGRVLP